MLPSVTQSFELKDRLRKL